MNEQQSGEGRDPKTGLQEDTSKIYLGDSSLQSQQEFEQDKNDEAPTAEEIIRPSKFADGNDPGDETGDESGDSPLQEVTSSGSVSGVDTDSTINITPDDDRVRQ
ncbi:MAG: hypothetical protein JWQ96_1382 [Segetibacter sp.]|nr:hypothetical protein [Segetibacter sp.]